MFFKIRFLSHTVTGLLGRDERLYWLANDIGRVLGFKLINWLEYSLQSCQRVMDVAADWEEILHVRNSKVLPHERMLEILEGARIKCSLNPVYMFLSKLDNLSTRVREVDGVLEFCEDEEGAVQFCAWLGWAKKKEFHPDLSEDERKFLSHFHNEEGPSMMDEAFSPNYFEFLQSDMERPSLG